MARKLFWGVFSLLVLYACVVFSNFSGSTKIEEALREVGGNSMPVAPYARVVAQFFTEHQRWPEASEVVLPKPPAEGMVHSVVLQSDGVLLLKLRGRVWLRRVQVRVAVLLQPSHAHFSWTSGCLDASPEAITNIIFLHCDRTTLAEAHAAQERAMAMREKYLEQQALDDAERQTSTE